MRGAELGKQLRFSSGPISHLLYSGKELVKKRIVKY